MKMQVLILLKIHLEMWVAQTHGMHSIFLEESFFLYASNVFDSRALSSRSVFKKTPYGIRVQPVGKIFNVTFQLGPAAKPTIVSYKRRDD